VRRLPSEPLAPGLDRPLGGLTARRGFGTDIAKPQGMAHLDRDEDIPAWLPYWLPNEILEEIYLGLLRQASGVRPVLLEDGERANGYIIQNWFGPFLLSPPTHFLRGSC
jgi:hypothetical protein